jgi:glycosyltransferase involved in cell wall biosynthesis
MTECALSFVIPLYNSADTIGSLVREIAALDVPGGHEIILVNDGSRDGTSTVCQRLLEEAAIPVLLVEHARNYGEHNAVLTGWRHARGAYIVNLDDDGQNPPAEALRLWTKARTEELDVVFGDYDVKRHAAWRNWGSTLTNRLTDWALDKPRGLYLSSFRCVSAFAARSVAANNGPFPYLDGLLLQVTQRIGSLPVQHRSRQVGRSGYTLRKLLADVDRWRYGQKAHLESSLEVLKLWDEEQPPQLESVEELDCNGAYGIRLLFATGGVPFRLWQERQERLGRFFGPGLVAELDQVDNAHLRLSLLPETAQAAAEA